MKLHIKKTSDGKFAVFAIFIMILGITFWAGIIYVAWHFISKFW